MRKNNEKQVQELELKNKALQTEVEELRNTLENVSVASDDGRIHEDYTRKLNDLEDQVGELKKKLEVQSQLLLQKQKHVEAAKQLHDEIQRMKAQKVQLQWNMKKQSVQFRLSKAALEKEVLQLKKEGSRYEYKMHRLLALNQGQKMVLQRKTQEASMAKILLLQKTRGSDANGRIQALDHEHDLSVRLQELYSEYEHQLEVRARMAAEIVNLKEEAEMLKHKNLRCLLEEEDDYCTEKVSEIKDLNKMVVELSGLVRQLEMEKEEFICREKSQGSQSGTSISHTVSDNDFQDMGLSEPEYSDMKVAESNRIDSGKQATEKRKSDSGAHYSGTGSNMLGSTDSEGLKTGTPVEEHSDVTGKARTNRCCSCSKKSSCKTLKCECRATNGSCGTSCGCAPTKCTNRDTDLFKKLDDLQQLETTEGRNCLGVAASHGELRLRSALVDKPAGSNSNCAPRGRALCDIGNTLIKPEEQRPNGLVPLAPGSLQQENTGTLKRPEKSVTTDMHFLPPRAESNANKPDKFINKKAGRPATRRSRKVAE